MGPIIHISHVMEDLPQAREGYGELAQAGFRPWLADDGLLPEQARGVSRPE